MKLRKMLEIKRDPEFSDSLLNDQKFILFVLSIGGSAVVLLWQLFDKFYVEVEDFRLQWLRLATFALYLANMATALVRKNSAAMKQHLVAGFYFGTIYCTMVVAFTGASGSPYWFSLIFIIIVWFILVPYDFREMIFHSIAFLAIFVFGQYIQSDYYVTGYEIGKIVFLYSGVLFVSFFAAYIRNKLDSENLTSKKNLDTKMRNFQKLTTTLEQKFKIIKQPLKNSQQINNFSITSSQVPHWPSGVSICRENLPTRNSGEMKPASQQKELASRRWKFTREPRWRLS